MTKRSKDQEGPHPVDRHVGYRLRIRRAELGLSQSAVGDAVGITFQQIQKYERAANRISASMLYEISKILAVTTEYFFYGFSDDDSGRSSFPIMGVELEAYLATAEGRQLSAALLLMPQQVRTSLIKLAAAIPSAPDDDKLEND